MNPNQIPYDPLDWLQIGVYFVALPIVAFVGALIGLSGRWRRGGVLWSTNVGLLGGAVALAIFGLGIWSLQTESAGLSYFREFTSRYRWLMLQMTLLSTAGCGLVAGLAWRFLHKPTEVRPIAFSLKQLLIVQGFSLVTLSVWMGLRLFLLQYSEELKQYDVGKLPPGWSMNPSTGLTTIKGLFTPQQELEAGLRLSLVRDNADSKHNLLVQLFYDSTWKRDLSPLLQDENIQVAYFNLLSVSPEFLTQLAESKIKQVSLNGNLRDIDLGVLGESTSTDRALLLWGAVSPKTIESLSESKRITHLQLVNANTAKGLDQPIQKWPKNLENLGLLRTTLSPRDLDCLADHSTLIDLYTPEIPFDAKLLKAISTISQLQKLKIGLAKLEDGALQPLAKLNCNKVELHVLAPEFSLTNAQELKNIQGLKLLDLTNSPIDDQTVEAIADISSIEELIIASHVTTETGLLTLAKIPRLQRLSISNLLQLQQFQANLNEVRQQLGLPYVQVNGVAPTSPLKAIIVE